jgi:hypothetical protein
MFESTVSTHLLSNLLNALLPENFGMPHAQRTPKREIICHLFGDSYFVPFSPRYLHVCACMRAHEIPERVRMYA